MIKENNWELFQDFSYFDMWAVRHKKDRRFDSPRLFHFNKRDDAVKFLSIVEKANIAEYKT